MSLSLVPTNMLVVIYLKLLRLNKRKDINRNIILEFSPALATVSFQAKQIQLTVIQLHNNYSHNYILKSITDAACENSTL